MKFQTLMEEDQAMMPTCAEDRKRTTSIFLFTLAGAILLSGCAFTRDNEDQFTAKSNRSPATTASATARSPETLARPIDEPPAEAQSSGPATPPVQSSTRLVSRPKVRGVLHANAADFDVHVLRSDVPVLVDFYATWCGPCQRLSPTLEAVAAETPQAKVVKVDIDDSPELAERYGVHAVPTLLVFQNGRVVAKEHGAVGKDRLMAMLNR